MPECRHHQESVGELNSDQRGLIEDPAGGIIHERRYPSKFVVMRICGIALRHGERTISGRPAARKGLSS
jgi:hypothetical protein